MEIKIEITITPPISSAGKPLMWRDLSFNQSSPCFRFFWIMHFIYSS